MSEPQKRKYDPNSVAEQLQNIFDFTKADLEANRQDNITPHQYRLVDKVERDIDVPVYLGTYLVGAAATLAFVRTTQCFAGLLAFLVYILLIISFSKMGRRLLINELSSNQLRVVQGILPLKPLAQLKYARDSYRWIVVNHQPLRILFTQYTDLYHLAQAYPHQIYLFYYLPEHKYIIAAEPYNPGYDYYFLEQ